MYISKYILQSIVINNKLRKRCFWLSLILVLALIVISVLSFLRYSNCRSSERPNGECNKKIFRHPSDEKKLIDELFGEMNSRSITQISTSQNQKSSYQKTKQHLWETQSSMLQLYNEFKLFQYNKVKRGFYVMTTLGIYMWETEDLNKPLVDSSYKQILQPLTEEENMVGLGVQNSRGIYVVPDGLSAKVKFFNMKQINNPEEYLVVKDQIMANCFLQSDNIAICCGNKTLVQYDLSSIEYAEKILYYNQDGNYICCTRAQNGNILIGGVYGNLTLLDPDGNFLSVSKMQNKTHTYFYGFAEVRPNIIVNSESTGFIINNISDPLNINRTLISGTVTSLLIILLRHKEGHFMVGGGREKPDTLFFIRIYYLEEDNLRASLIKEIITPMNTTKY